ncbi:MAG: hypothetical protein ACPGVN_06970, partial [Alphaproteobacteria bacterium]
KICIEETGTRYSTLKNGTNIMTRTAPFQAAFSRGELSPRALGRSDLAQYGFGLKTCLNAVIAPRGEFEKRPGTRFVTSTKNDGEVRLIPFEVSDDQAYMIEAGAGYFRFFSNRTQVQDTSTGQAHEVATPYTVSELKDISWAQSADVLYICHKNHPPKRLDRTAANSFVLTDIALKRGPFDPLNTDPNCQIYHDTISQTLKFVGCAPLTASDVGRSVRIWTGLQWVDEVIFAVVSPTEAIYEGFGTLVPNGSGTGPTPDWQLGSFYTGNYPAEVVFHEDRLVFANTKTNPQTFWMSQSGAYHDFMPSTDAGVVENTSAIRGVLNDREVNAIQWLLSVDNQLLIGTSSGPWSVSAGVDYNGLTPGSVRMHRQSKAASSPIRPLLAGPSVVYAHRSRRKLLALDPDAEFGRFTSPNLNLLADHMLDEGVTALAYQEEPYSIIWCQLENGELAGLTYDPLQKVYAWHRHTLGGQGLVEALQTIPEPDLVGDFPTGDDLWLVVKRTVGGQERRYIEHLGGYWGHRSNMAQAAFVDCAGSYSGAAVTSVSGLSHLEGETLSVLADGWVDAPAQVSSGTVTLGRPTADVTVGLPYEAKGELLDLSSGAANGTSIAKSRHLYEVFVKVWRSLGFWAGPDAAHLKEFQFRNRPSPQTQFVEPETTDIRIARDEGGWERQTRFSWRHAEPLPLVILALSLRVATSD